MVLLRIAAILLFAASGMQLSSASEAPAGLYSVQVVMSYEEDNPWCIDVKKGIMSSLSQQADLTFFYLDTKKNIKEGPAKARQAYEVFKATQFDGVIAVDDYAQSMYVVKYLRNRVATPVIFSGVNARPETYGYPAGNVSGILERNFIGPSIAMAKQLVPTIETVGFIARNSSSGVAIKNQVFEEQESYLVKVVDFKLVAKVDQLMTEVDNYRQTADLLFIDATNGILDQGGKALSNRQVTEIVTKAFGKPVIGANRFHVQYGALCAVIKSGVTQGRVAGDMLLAAMQGTPLADLAIRKNEHGKRLLNVRAMKALGIQPSRRVLLGAELINSDTMP